MTLVPRNLILKRTEVKGKPALALDTGFDAESMEGLRLVKASRGSGWVYHEGQIRPWITRGVLQEDSRLVVWGDEVGMPEGHSPAVWPQEGDACRGFLKAFTAGWIARSTVDEPMPPFSPSVVLPWKTESGWAFVFPPAELRGVLDSLQPFSERLPWDHYRHPDAPGASSWAFTTAALGVFLVSGTLPWVQADDSHLRQELRTLKRTLLEDELPEGLGDTLKLWYDALTCRDENPVGRWKAWLAQDRPWGGVPTAERTPQRTQARLKRERRRKQAAFWRLRGTVVTAVAVTGAVLAAVVGSVVWGIVKPDPTDTWTPDQVVAGYYAGLTTLDSDGMRKVTSFDGGREPALVRDQEEATNLYVIRQVRTAYEHESPILDAVSWESAGKPPLPEGKMLYGIAGLEVEHQGVNWTVRYRKWASESGDDKVVRIVGFSVVDRLVLAPTGRGWKITSLHRDREPLP